MAQGCYLNGPGVASNTFETPPSTWTSVFPTGNVEVYTSNCCKSQKAWHWTVGIADVFYNSTYPMNDVVIDPVDGVTADIISATATTIRIRWKFSCPINNSLGYILVEMFPCGQDANRIVKLGCPVDCQLIGWCVHNSNCIQFMANCPMCITYKLNNNFIYVQQIGSGTTEICNFGFSITAVEILSTVIGNCDKGFGGVPMELASSADILNHRINSISGLQIYPNPAKENVIFSFNLEKSESVNAFITDLSGKVVLQNFSGELSKGKHEINLMLHELSNGMYFTVLEVNGKRAIQKLVVQK